MLRAQVEYVFSDKTGTLTSNEMQLRMLAIKGETYGNAKFKCGSLTPCMVPSQAPLL